MFSHVGWRGTQDAERIPLFHFGFHSGLNTFECIWPRAACLDMNFSPLICQHITGVPRFSLPAPAQGWPNAASRRSLKWSLSIAFPLVWTSTSLLVRADLPKISWNFSSQMAKVINSSAKKNTFLEALALFFHFCSDILFIRKSLVLPHWVGTHALCFGSLPLSSRSVAITCLLSCLLA